MCRTTSALVLALVAIIAADPAPAHACNSNDTWVGGLVATRDGKRLAHWTVTTGGGAETSYNAVYLTDLDGQPIAVFESNDGPHYEEGDPAGGPAWRLRSGPKRLARLMAGVKRGDQEEMHRRVAAHLDMKPLGPAFDPNTPLVATDECGAWLLRLRDIQTPVAKSDPSEDDGEGLYERKIRALARTPLTQAQVDACDFRVMVSVQVEPSGGCGYQTFSWYNRWNGAKVRRAIADRKAAIKQRAALNVALSKEAGEARAEALQTYLRGYPKDGWAWHALFVALQEMKMPWPMARPIVAKMPRVVDYDIHMRVELENHYELEARGVETAHFRPGDWNDLPDYQRWRRTRTVLAKARAVPWLVSEREDCFADPGQGACGRDEDTGLFYELEQ
jgi:hypothetical protein